MWRKCGFTLQSVGTEISNGLKPAYFLQEVHILTCVALGSADEPWPLANKFMLYMWGYPFVNVWFAGKHKQQA